MEIILGFFISFAIALTGVGAGTITAPVLILFLGIEPSVAIGTALLFSVMAKIPVGILYQFRKLVNSPVLFRMCWGGIPGVLIGSVLLNSLNKDESLRSTIVTVIGVIVLLSAALNLYFMIKKTDAQKQREKLKPYLPLFTFLIGLEVGFSSAGAGALGTLILMYTTKLEPKQVVGTDIVFGLILSGIGGGFHLALGQIQSDLIFKLFLGTLAGVPAGVLTSNYLPPQRLKTIILVWVIFIGSLLIYRGL